MLDSSTAQKRNLNFANNVGSNSALLAGFPRFCFNGVYLTIGETFEKKYCRSIRAFSWSAFLVHAFR